jgi:hypothetical protein
MRFGTSSQKNTLRTYQSLLSKLTAQFGERGLDSITSEEVLSFITQICPGPKREYNPLYAKPNGLALWLKFGQTEFLCNILPCHFHEHLAFHLIESAPYDIGEEARPLIEFHVRHHIGKVVFKPRMIGHMIDTKAVNLAFSFGDNPLRLV